MKRTLSHILLLSVIVMAIVLLPSCSTICTSETSLPENYIDTFTDTLSEYGFICIDVSELNSDTYPTSTVYQAYAEGITIYCVSGTTEESQMAWDSFYFNKVNSEDTASYYLDFNPEDLSEPRIFTADSTTNDAYYRCDVNGGVCIFATAEPESLSTYVNTLFEKLGFPLTEEEK
jgi:hypothetical protein